MEFRLKDAVCYGVDEAIIINHLRYWILYNKRNDKHFYDNKYWTYNSINALTSCFPFWSIDQIRRIIASLIKQDVIITGNYNKLAYDRTKWYAFSDNAESVLYGEYKDFDLVKSPNDTWENHQMTCGEFTKPIPDNNTDNITDNNICKKKKFTKKSKVEKEFIPPTLEQVKDYCVNVRKNNVDYKRFYDYYEVNGWKDGINKPLVNWKQKIVAWWEPKAKEYSRPNATQSLEDNRKAFKDMTEAEKVEYWRKIDAEIAERNNRRG